MGKPTAADRAQKLELFEKLVATDPSVERKGATTPFTSANGRMFSFLTKAGTLALRLPAGEREAFLKAHKTRLCVQHGTVLEEFVEVPDRLLARPRALKRYFDMSAAYARSLPPKLAARRRRKSAKKKR